MNSSTTRKASAAGYAAAERCAHYCQWAIVSLGICFAGLFVLLACVHIRFPFALEWMEGSMFTHVHRVLAGKPLYVRPSLEFVTAMYTPLYFYLAAVGAQIFGEGFAALRLVSFLASCGSCALIYAITVQQTRNRFAGLAGACLFAATYRIGGPYLDMARVDAAFLFFFLSAVYLVMFPASRRSSAYAGAFMAFTLLTKQTGLVLFVPLMLSCLLVHGRYRAGVFLLMAAAITAGASWIIYSVHGIWYMFYIFVLPRQQLVFDMFVRFWLNEIGLALPFAGIMTIIYVAGCRARGAAKEGLAWLLILGAMVGVACAGRMKLGAFKNTLMLAHAALALISGLGLAEAGRLLRTIAPRRGPVLECVVLAACLAQFTSLLYNPFPLLPDKQYKTICRELAHAISAIDGRVFAPAYGYLCVMAGKTNSAHIGYINDLRKGAPLLVTKRFANQMRADLRAQRFSVIMLDRKFDWFHDDIERYYTRLPGFFPGSHFWPLIKYCYVPKKAR